MAAETDTSSALQLENQEADGATKKLEKMNISFSIWPPTQRTRDAVTKSLVKHLSTPSILSKRYGAVPTEEAISIAERIEDEAFVAASASSPSADDDGIEVLQGYSKEISQWMLDYMKSKSDLPVAASTVDDESVATAATAVDSAAHNEEGSKVEAAESVRVSYL